MIKQTEQPSSRLRPAEDCFRCFSRVSEWFSRSSWSHHSSWRKFPSLNTRSKKMKCLKHASQSTWRPVLSGTVFWTSWTAAAETVISNRRQVFNGGTVMVQVGKQGKQITSSEGVHLHIIRLTDCQKWYTSIKLTTQSRVTSAIIISFCNTSFSSRKTSVNSGCGHRQWHVCTAHKHVTRAALSNNQRSHH